MPWIKRIVNQIQKGTKEQEVKKNTEFIINFNSKTSPSKTLTANAAIFSTG